MILLTAAELGDLRQALRLSTRSDASPEDRELFAALFACWCHNPVATFSLCLLAQAYDVSAELVKEVAEVEISVGFLMQVRRADWLVGGDREGFEGVGVYPCGGAGCWAGVAEVHATLLIVPPPRLPRCSYFCKARK